VENKMQVAYFRRVSPLYAVNLVILMLTDAYKQNGVEVCQKSCKSLQAFWRCEQWNV